MDRDAHLARVRDADPNVFGSRDETATLHFRLNNVPRVMDASQERTPSRAPIAEASIEPDESAGRVVLVAVAAVSNRRVEALPRLSDVVDPDALDALFADRPTPGLVTFRYAGFVVVVTAAGEVQVYDEA